MELKDTIELMTSKDYKERFKDEYLQLKIRVEELRSGALDDIRMKMEVLQLPEENNMIKILAKNQS